ncbi:indole-3-acetaldehyde oxidase-like [Lolium rigidum]|uniref:indole-3-acetaldehyde oxidase-like n=1 Tax=Lolium rigidum TaxID=89674 RepID=UPI001F5DD3DF|nr:indole-3-acetaldehyde oxidase-like [Lolium rigidum]
MRGDQTSVRRRADGSDDDPEERPAVRLRAEPEPGGGPRPDCLSRDLILTVFICPTLSQVVGSFVQGVGFFTNEEYATNADGMVINDGTWTYKIPTVDTIPKHLNVELINSARDRKRVLSSKASGEPPLLLAASVHCAMREAIRAARTQFSADSPLTFQMDVPATMAHVKDLCGLDVVERHLHSLSAAAAAPAKA